MRKVKHTIQSETGGRDSKEQKWGVVLDLVWKEFDQGEFLSSMLKPVFTACMLK